MAHCTKAGRYRPQARVHWPERSPTTLWMAASQKRLAALHGAWQARDRAKHTVRGATSC